MVRRRHRVTKQDKFMMMVQTAVVLSFGGRKLDHHNLQATMLDLEIAYDIRGRIPDEVPAYEAAVDFAFHYLYPFCYEEEGPDYAPAEWMGALTTAQFEAMRGPTEVLIDGKWVLDDPDWAGLPYSDSASLKILVFMRDSAPVPLSKLSTVVPELHRNVVRRMMKGFEAQGWVTMSGNRRSVVWSSTQKLRDTKPKTPASREEARIAAEEETRRAKEERKEKRKADLRRQAEERRTSVLQDPDVRRLFAKLRRNESVTMTEARPMFPALDRNSVVRLLKRLRDYGWIEVVGEGRNAAWRAAEQLRSGMPKTSKRSKAPARP